MKSEKIEKYINSLAQVKLYYFDEEIYCQIVKQSDKLILAIDIKEWHYDAYMIFKKKHIDKIKYGKIQKCREKILHPLSQNYLNKEINNIDISTIKSALNSLYKSNYGVCIEELNNEKQFFNVGLIKNVKDKSILLEEIDICGKLKQDLTKIKYKNITTIIYKDEYSSKLTEFALLDEVKLQTPHI